MATPGEPRRLAAMLDATTRGWAVVLSGDVARMALGFLTGVLIARALGPARFGVYVVLGAASAIGSALVDAGLSQAAVVRIAGVVTTDQKSAMERGRSFFWTRMVTATVVTLLAMVLAPRLAELIGVPETVDGWSGSKLLILALAGVVAAALGGAVSTLLQAAGRFGPVSAMLITNAGITLVLAAVLATVDHLSLVAALVVLGILPSLLTFLIGVRLLGERWLARPTVVDAVRREAVELFRIGGWLWLAGLLTALAVRLDLLLVNRLSSMDVVGGYGLAFSLAASLGAAGGSLYTVLLPAASALRDGGERRTYLRRGLIRSGVFSVMLVPLVVLARPFILLVYGSEYAPAVPFLQMLVPVVALELLVMPLMLLAIPLGRPQWLGAAGALRVLVVAALCWLLIPSWGPAGAVAARAASVAAGAGLVALALARRRPTGPRMVDPDSGYAEWADRYPPAAHNPLMAAEEAAMRSLLGAVEGAVCLDAACGSGRYLRMLAGAGAARTVGLDAVPRMVAEARRRGTGHELVLGRFEELPFGDGRFDLVVSGLAVGHARDLDQVLAEFGRVLRPGGLALYSDLHPEAVRAGAERTFVGRDGVVRRLEHRVHELTDHRRACQAAGLTVDAVLEPFVENAASPGLVHVPAVLVIRATKGPS